MPGRRIVTWYSGRSLNDYSIFRSGAFYKVENWPTEFNPAVTVFDQEPQDSLRKMFAGQSFIYPEEDLTRGPP